CADIAAARGLDPVLARLGRYAAAEREARTDLTLAAVGLLATLAGIAAFCQPFSSGSRGVRARPWVRRLRTVWGILALGASAWIPGAQILLAASGSLAIERLLEGAPPSAELFGWSIHRAIELLAAVVQNA